MTITQTFENLSAETPDAVNIAKFANSWTLTAADAANDGKTNATVYKVAGESAGYPLVLRIEVGPTRGLFHPDYPSVRYDGIRASIKAFTTVKVENSVDGSVVYVPVTSQVTITYGAPVLENVADIQQFVLSTVAELWSSVTTAVPDLSQIQKIALGASDIN